MAIFILSGCSSTPRVKTEKLISCKAPKGTDLSIFKLENGNIMALGSVEYKKYRSSRDSKIQKQEIIIPGVSKFFYYETKNSNGCNRFGFHIMDDPDSLLDRCLDARAKLEWARKYDAKIGFKKTKKGDAKSAKIFSDIRFYCSELEGKIADITYFPHSSPDNKDCSRGQLTLYQVTSQPEPAYYSPIQPVYSEKCELNHSILNKLKQGSKPRKPRKIPL